MRTGVYAILLLAMAMAMAMAMAQAAVAEEGHDCVMQPKTTIELGSPDEGIMHEVLVARGDVVEAGATVARLDMRLERLAAKLAQLRAEGDTDIRSGRAQLAFRDREVGRMTELRQRDLASQKEYDSAEIERRLAALQVERAELEHELAAVEHERARTLLARREIRAPTDGVVVEVTIAPGEYAHEQAPVMTIAQIDPLHVEVYVPVDAWGTIETGMVGEVLPDEPIGGVYPAEVTVVDRVFDAASGTFGVRLELPNPEHALPAGVRCRVRFPGAGGA